MILDSFLAYALIAGVLVALISGPVGTLVVWRRLAYFGDTLSHGALLGVALALLWQLPMSMAITVTAAALAFLLFVLQQQRTLANDTLLGILSHSALSIALVVMALMHNVRVDLMAYLFGDLLTVTTTDLVLLALAATVVFGWLYYCWQPLLSMTVNEDMARIEGVAVERQKLLLMLVIAMLVAVAMKIVGALIITAMLLIPAAAARQLARNPDQMAIGATVIGIGAVIAGIGLSWWQDTPAGPSVVVCASSIFVATLLFRRHKDAS